MRYDIPGMNINCSVPFIFLAQINRRLSSLQAPGAELSDVEPSKPLVSYLLLPYAS